MSALHSFCHSSRNASCDYYMHIAKSLDNEMKGTLDIKDLFITLTVFSPPQPWKACTMGSATLNEEATTTTECSVPPPSKHSNPTLTSLSHTCFFSLALCLIVSAFDSTMVPTTIPTLTAAFHAGSVVQLVSTVYLLSTTSFQMLYGRFSDIFGRKVSITVALFIFIVGSLATGFSTTLIQLLISRAIAGAGGGKIPFFVII